MNKIYVVRHGESYANLDGILNSNYNFDNAPLTPTGVILARKTGEFLRQELKRLPYQIYCSSFRRTQHTLETLGIGDPYIVTPALREIDIGNVARMSRVQSNLYSETERLGKWVDKSTWNKKYPLGESYADVEKRVRPLYEQWCRYDKIIVVVMHCVVGNILCNLHDGKGTNIPFEYCEVKLLEDNKERRTLFIPKA